MRFVRNGSFATTFKANDIEGLYKKVVAGKKSIL